MRWNVSAALLVCALSGAAAFSPLQAQDYPSRNVTLVLPLAAGTGLDTIARLYGEKLSESLGPSGHYRKSAGRQYGDGDAAA